jgi:hypothetical protein
MRYIPMFARLFAASVGLVVIVIASASPVRGDEGGCSTFVSMVCTGISCSNEDCESTCEHGIYTDNHTCQTGAGGGCWCSCECGGGG